MTQPEFITITVNGTKKHLRNKLLSYEDILEMTGHKRGAVITVTYLGPKREDSSRVARSLTRGQSLVAEEGAVIDATHTGNA